MKLRLATTIACGFLLAAPVHAAETVAIVNGKTITTLDMENYKILRSEQISETTPTTDELIEELIKRELVIQDAELRGLDKTDNFIMRYQAIRGNLLANLATQQFLRDNAPSDEQLRQRYAQEMASIEFPNEYKTRHILVEGEELAQQLIARLETGEEFAPLAEEFSTDSSSAAKGGDVGWIRAEQVVAEFGAALKDLEPGQYTKTPVQTNFGWHIALLEEVRAVQPPPFAAIKNQVAELLKEETVAEYIDGLRAAATVEIVTSEALPEQQPTEEAEEAEEAEE